MAMERLETLIAAIAASRRAALIASANEGGDDDIAEHLRPNRADRSDLGALKDDDDVTVSGQIVRVICPGRGLGWFYSLAIEGETIVIGQHEAQHVTDRAPADPSETPMPIFPEPER